MKIMHVISSLAQRYGGPSKACIDMAGAVGNLGHEVSVYTTNIDGNNVSNKPIGKTINMDGFDITQYAIGIPRGWCYSKGLGRALENDIPKFDLIHIHSLYLFPGIKAGQICRRYGVPYIIRPHGTLDPFVWKRHRCRKNAIEILYERTNIKRAEALHYTAEEEQILAMPYVDGAKGIILPLGIIWDDYINIPESGGLRNKYPEINNKKIILFLGRLSYKKGLDILLDSFKLACKVRDDIHLVLAGPDDELLGAKNLKYVNENGLIGKVTFTGMINGKDKANAFRDASVFVLPSYSENFGISVIEAMASGTPVIISNKVNIWREVVNSGGGEVLNLSVNNWASALEAIPDRQDILIEMGKKGRQYVRRNFTWDVLGPQYVEAYKRIIETRRNRNA